MPEPVFQHRKSCRRYNEPGHAHALTFSCFRRQPFLSKDQSRQWMIDAISRARDKHGFHLWGYVIMPEHVHLLIRPTTAEYSVSSILSTLKQSVTQRALAFVRSQAPRFLSAMEDLQPNGLVHHRFWQRGGGYDRNLTEPKTIWNTIEYMHANPVRRGLCLRPTDWLWSSAIEYLMPEKGLLSIDRESLPRSLRG